MTEDNVMLVDALRVMFAETTESWDAPKIVDIAALPLSHPDEMTRRIMWGRIRSFAFGIAEQAAAGETPEQLQVRIERAIRKIVTADNVAPPDLGESES